MEIRMRKNIFIITGVFLLLTASAPMLSQFTPEELAQREAIEEFLLNAEIVKAEEVGHGVTKPLKLYLKSDGKEDCGCWKNPHGKMQGFLEGWQYEIAAYRMDKLLELNLIPPTVKRAYKGKKGSLQYWVETEYSYLDLAEKNIPVPASMIRNFEKIKYITRAFDSLIANEDRTQQNMRFSPDWRVILIDHSRSFRSTKKFTRKLMFGKKGIMGNKPFRQLPRSFVEKIKALNLENIKNAVGPYLKDNEIDAVLKRRDLLLKEIEEMIEEMGEENFLYD
jgi:hypothetical protein